MNIKGEVPIPSTIPEKFWELMRDNPQFRTDEVKLDCLYKSARDMCNSDNPGVIEEGRQQWWEAKKLIEAVAQRHSFAAYALQWLVPQPYFIEYRFASVRELDAEGQEHWFDHVGSGTTPDPNDTKNWSWRVRNGKPSINGRPCRLGPEIRRTIQKDQEHPEGYDPFAWWREWYERKVTFTLEDSWATSPVGFRSRFESLWAEHDSRHWNPADGSASGLVRPHETFFFQEWSLLSLVNRACSEIKKANGWLRARRPPGEPTKFGILAKIPQADLQLTQVERERLLTFNDLARDYRVLALPRTVLTKGAARSICDWLYQELLRDDLPDDKTQFFGTEGEWRDYLGVKQLRASTHPARDAAITAWVDRTYAEREVKHERKERNGELAARDERGIRTDERRSHEVTVRRRVERIEQLVARIYPEFNLVDLLKRPEPAKKE